MLIGQLSKVVRVPTNGATLPLLASCIGTSEKFDVNKQIFLATKNWLTYSDIEMQFPIPKDKTLILL